MKLIDEIAVWIRDVVRSAGARGVVVGLSGGIDSAVVAALARRALGDDVLGVLLPCHSLAKDEVDARDVAVALGLEIQRVDLAPVYDAFLAVLPVARQRLAAANLKPRLRMTALYYLASERGYLVAGTGNKSELMTGYFTKHGDGGVDLLPIGGLYKSEVRALARELGIPAGIVEKPPSAGLWEGQTDEGDLGVTYGELDRALMALGEGRHDEREEALVAKVEVMVAKSAHKRALPAFFEPARTVSTIRGGS